MHLHQDCKPTRLLHVRREILAPFLLRVCNLARMSMNVAMGGEIVPEWTTADRMRKAREIRGLSQPEFAAETGLSRSTIFRVESGEKQPGTKEFNLWRMATGVSREWLETGRAPEPSGPRPGGGQVTQDTFN